MIGINLPPRGPSCLSWALHWRPYGAWRSGPQWPNGFGFKNQTLDGCNLELPHPLDFMLFWGGFGKCFQLPNDGLAWPTQGSGYSKCST